MELKEAVKLALQSLWQNKLRTVLTLLGVMIGVSSVIAVVTLVNGANTYVTTKFSSYGADVFTVSRMPALIMNSADYERYQRSEEHTSELQSLRHLVCRLLLEKKKKDNTYTSLYAPGHGAGGMYVPRAVQ